jgi:hypothetical protein
LCSLEETIVLPSTNLFAGSQTTRKFHFWWD